MTPGKRTITDLLIPGLPPMLDYVLIALAILALAGVVFEEVLHVNKAKTTLFFGTTAWILLFINASFDNSLFISF